MLGLTARYVRFCSRTMFADEGNRRSWSMGREPCRPDSLIGESLSRGEHDSRLSAASSLTSRENWSDLASPCASRCQSSRFKLGINPAWPRAKGTHLRSAGPESDSVVTKYNEYIPMHRSPTTSQNPAVKHLDALKCGPSKKSPRNP